MKFIEVTSQATGEKFAINVSTISRIYREDDGCFIVTLETKRSGYGSHVKESYDTIMARLNGHAVLEYAKERANK